MPFRVEFSELAAARFRKLDGPVKARLAAKLRLVAKDPARHLKRLTGIRAFTLRVGDWRILLDVDWDGEVLYVLTLGHRSNIYG